MCKIPRPERLILGLALLSLFFILVAERDDPSGALTRPARAREPVRRSAVPSPASSEQQEPVDSAAREARNRQTLRKLMREREGLARQRRSTRPAALPGSKDLDRLLAGADWRRQLDRIADSPEPRALGLLTRIARGAANQGQRAHATLRLGRRAEPAALALIDRLLEAEEPRVRRAAALAATLRVHRDPRALPLLARARQVLREQARADQIKPNPVSK